MSTRGISLIVVGAASLVACNAVTGLGDLEFNRDATGAGGSTGSAEGGGSSTGSMGGEGGGVDLPDPDLVWARQYGDEGEDYPTALAFAENGDLLFGGSFSGTLDLGGGAPVNSANFASDAFVARLRSDGTPVYVSPIDASVGQDCLRDMAFLSTGEVLALVGSGASAECLAANYPSSPAMSSGLFSTGLNSFRLFKLGADGVPVSDQEICMGCQFDPADNVEGPMTVATDANDSFFIGGSFSFGYFFAPGNGIPANGPIDAFVVKYNAAGNPAFFKDLGTDNGFSVVTDLVPDGTGGVVAAGIFQDRIRLGGNVRQIPAADSPIFVVRFNDDGDHVWSAVFAKGWGGSPPRLALTSDGVIMAGDFYDTIDFGGGELLAQGATPGTSDAYLVKFSLQGAHMWSRRFGDVEGPLKEQQGVTSIVVEQDGNLLLGGAFGGTLDLGTRTLTAVGKRDAFILRLDASGNPLTQRHIPSAAVATMQGDVFVTPGAGGHVAVTGAFIGDVDYGGEQPFQSLSQNAAYNDGLVVLYKEPLHQHP